MSERLRLITERVLEYVDCEFEQESDKLQALYTISLALARIANRGITAVEEAFSIIQQARKDADFVSEITSDFTAQKLGRPS